MNPLVGALSLLGDLYAQLQAQTDRANRAEQRVAELEQRIAELAPAPSPPAPTDAGVSSPG